MSLLDFDFDNPPRPYDIGEYGTDSSGRKILMSARMALALTIALPDADELGTWIVQGAWMERLGGGADASAGYHDKDGCVDLHTNGLSKDTMDTIVRRLRAVGWAAWRRDSAHGGFDPHCHAALMGTRPSQAAWGERDQEAQYIDGQDGLSGHGADYEHRPDPLVTDFDYYEELRKYKEQQMPTPQDLFDAKIGAKDGSTFGQVLKKLNLFLTLGVPGLRDRLNGLDQGLADIEAKVGDTATKDQVRKMRADVKGVQDDLDKLSTEE